MATVADIGHAASEKQFAAAVMKLSLKPGDILIVDAAQFDFNSFANLQVPGIDFIVPIVMCYGGSLQEAISAIDYTQLQTIIDTARQAKLEKATLLQQPR